MFLRSYPSSAAPFRVFDKFTVGVVLLQLGQLETPEEIGAHGRLGLGSDRDVGDGGSPPLARHTSSVLRQLASIAGKSSRVCPPRLSVRCSAALATHSLTSSIFRSCESDRAHARKSCVLNVQYGHARGQLVFRNAREEMPDLPNTSMAESGAAEADAARPSDAGTFVAATDSALSPVSKLPPLPMNPTGSRSISMNWQVNFMRCGRAEKTCLIYASLSRMIEKRRRPGLPCGGDSHHTCVCFLGQCTGRNANNSPSAAICAWQRSRATRRAQRGQVQ